MTRCFDRDGFKENVLRSWKYSPPQSIPPSSRIRYCCQAMSEWKYRNKPNSAIRIQDLQQQLDQGITLGTLNTSEIRQLRAELQRAYMDEEQF